jgi:50S ribosomal subunit-associated GTPase HflX
MTGFNIDMLLATVDYKINGSSSTYLLMIPNSDLKNYYWLYENRKTDNVEFGGEGVTLEAVLYDNEKEQFNKYITGIKNE